MGKDIPLWFFKEPCGLGSCSVRHEEFIDFKYRFVRTLLEDEASLAPVNLTV